MKIIAFGDIHEDIHNVDKMANLSTASVVVITGDLTNIGKRENAQRVIEYVKRYNQSVYALAGNFDQKDVCDYLSESGINLHGNAFVFQNVGIFGVGGSNPTPFHTPNEYSEEELEALIYKGYQIQRFQV